jgi:restriction endonuclease S subunit
MYEGDSGYLKFVDFTHFEKWDVKRHYHKINVEFLNKVVFLGNILKPYKKGINKEYIINNKLNIISKINFGGELFLRNFNEISTYKGNLFLVPGNSIIYSKINVRHGCIYYHQKNETPFAVSNEYPIYTFDENRIDGRFIQKLIRSNYFKSLLNTKTSGISKARVKQDEFLDLQIPLPTIEEQKAILDDYQQKIEKAKQQEIYSKNLEQSIEEYLFEELGIVENNFKKNKTTFLSFINFSETRRWDSLNLIRENNKIHSKYNIRKFKDVISKFNKKSSGESLRIESYRTPEKEFRYVGMENIEKESGVLLEITKVLGKDIKSQTLIVPNNFLIYGKLRPYLNKYWINETDFDNIICSSEFFVFDVDENKINRLFFKYVLSSKIIQTQISDKTSGARMPRINEDVFFNLNFPLPPLEKQKEIAEHISDIKNQIKSLKQNAETLKTEAEKEFEEKIFN